jgi:hypothetical protein
MNLGAAEFWREVDADREGAAVETAIWWKDTAGRGVGVIGTEGGQSYGRLSWQRADGTRGVDVYGPGDKEGIEAALAAQAEKEFPDAEIHRGGAKREIPRISRPSGRPLEAAREAHRTHAATSATHANQTERGKERGSMALSQAEVSRRIRIIVDVTKAMLAKGGYPHQGDFGEALGISSPTITVFMAAHQAELAKLGLRGGGQKGYFLEGDVPPQVLKERVAGLTPEQLSPQPQEQSTARHLSRPGRSGSAARKSGPHDATFTRQGGTPREETKPGDGQYGIEITGPNGEVVGAFAVSHEKAREIALSALGLE